MAHLSHCTPFTLHTLHTTRAYLLQFLEHGRRARLRGVAVLDDRLAEAAREFVEVERVEVALCGRAKDADGGNESNNRA